jgi:uncharacterized protein YjbI with pentapeptide repeats
MQLDLNMSPGRQMPTRPTSNATAHSQRDSGDLSGKCLDGVNLTDRLIEHTKFDRASLKNAILSRAEFRDCSFVGAQFDHAVMERATFENCDFSNAFVTNANVQKAVFRATSILGYEKKQAVIRHTKSSFNGATLDGSKFNGARLVAALLHNVKARGVDFSNCDLRNSSFDGSSLDEVQFGGARLNDANFSKCPDARSYLSEYAQIVAKFVIPISKSKLEDFLASHQKWLDTNGAQGDRLNLQGYDLTGQSLNGFDFSGTDFRGARLDRASLKNVKLVAADLRDASLIGTNFTSADLRGALLSENALRRAVLKDTHLEEPASAAL